MLLNLVAMITHSPKTAFDFLTLGIKPAIRTQHQRMVSKDIDKIDFPGLGGQMNHK